MTRFHRKSFFWRIWVLLTAFLSLISWANSTVAGDCPGLQILVYGATGKLGVHIVDEALERGHCVTAVSRDPSRIERQHEHLVAAKGDLLDEASIAELAAGKDVVIVSVRGIVGDRKDPKNAIQFIAAKNIVGVLRGMGDDAPRLIHVGGAASLLVRPNVYYAETLPKLFLPKRLESEMHAQILVLEFLRAVTDVVWTYATPPKNFTNGPRTGEYRTGGDSVMKDRRRRSRVSRADFAVALIDEAESGNHVQQRFSVAY